MIRLGVISDSHGGSVRLEMFAKVAQRENFDAILHCGDGQSDAKWLARTLDIPVRFVAGNCDFFGDADRELRTSYEQVRLLAVHGDRFGVKLTLDRLSYYAEEIGAQVALFGHTHEPFAGFAGRTMMVNPGSLAQGRYAVLEISGAKAVPYLKVLE